MRDSAFLVPTFTEPPEIRVYDVDSSFVILADLEDGDLLITCVAWRTSPASDYAAPTKQSGTATVGTTTQLGTKTRWDSTSMSIGDFELYSTPITGDGTLTWGYTVPDSTVAAIAIKNASTVDQYKLQGSSGATSSTATLASAPTGKTIGFFAAGANDTTCTPNSGWTQLDYDMNGNSGYFVALFILESTSPEQSCGATAATNPIPSNSGTLSANLEVS